MRDKFKELFDNSLDLIYVHDFKGNFLDANDIALLSLGYEKEELNVINFKNLIDKEQISIAFEVLKEIKENGKQLKSSQYKLKIKNGNYIYVETYGIPLRKDGIIYGILGIAKDITDKIKNKLELEKTNRELEGLKQELEQKVIERTQKLKELNHQIEFILGATKTGFNIIDSSYNLIYIDPEWAKVYGDPRN
ncbi:MAG TPA: PAS domain S-box protein, partial [Candidatus Lokiarchaeia archaeon]